MAEPKKLILVGCGQEKREKRCKVKSMYTSTLFRAARAYAEMHGDWWYVLSARWPTDENRSCGWLDPEEIVEPYDRTLKGLGRDNVKQWVAWVQGCFSSWCSEHPEHVKRPAEPTEGYAVIQDLRVIVLAGEMYVNPLREHSDQCGFSRLIETPLEGLQIGERVKWLQDRAGGRRRSRKRQHEHGAR